MSVELLEVRNEESVDAIPLDTLELMAFGLPAVRLNSFGYSVWDLIDAGCSVGKLSDIGYSLPELRSAGCSLRDLDDTLSLVRQYPLIELKMLGFTSDELQTVGFSMEA